MNADKSWRTCWKITASFVEGFGDTRDSSPFGKRMVLDPPVDRPRDRSKDEFEFAVGDPDVVEFELRDCDGEIYFEGYGRFGPEATRREPLDEWGAPKAGCVSIHFLTRGSR
jgi:hypothetical protein